MRSQLATAFDDLALEQAVVRYLQQVPSLTVERRCRDVIELRALGFTGRVDVVIVDPHLRGLTTDTVGSLRSAGMRVLGYAKEPPPTSVLDARDLVTGDLSNIIAALEDAPPSGSAAANTAVEPDQLPSGLVTAVWGPPGAPGRTSVAIEVAASLAATDADVMLVDADTLAPSIGARLGLPDDAPNLASAARAAVEGTLSPVRLAGMTYATTAGVRVLLGLPAIDRWQELRPSALEAVMHTARHHVDHVVVDVGFATEGDALVRAEGISPERFVAARTTLLTADVVLAVCQTDPVSVVRFLRSIDEVRSLSPTAEQLVVINRAESTSAREVAAVLGESTGLTIAATVPDDNVTFRRAVQWGRTLRESTGMKDPVRKTFDELAARVASYHPSYDVGRVQAPGAHRRLLRRPDRRNRHRDARVGGG